MKKRKRAAPPTPSEASAPSSVDRPPELADDDRAAAPPPAASASTSRERWIDRAIVALAALVVFARALPYPLVASWDDRRFLIDDPLVQHPSLSSLWSIVSEPHFEAYHPLHLLSYWVDVPWFGPVGWAVRVTNLLIFAGAGMLLLTWLRELGVGRWPALVATLAFVLHPVQVELVVWGTGRKDGLADLLALAAWVAHLRAKDPWGRAAWASRALFLLACLAKTSAVPLPLAMLALDVCTKRRSLRDAIVWQLPSFAIAIGLGVLTISIWSANDMIRPLARGASSISLVLTSVTHAVATAAWPATTSPLYALVDDDPPSLAWTVAGALVLAALGALAYARREATWARWLGGGILVFVALFLPVSNILPTYFHFQDRHLSLPFVGMALVLASLLSWLDGPAPNVAITRAPSAAFLFVAAACVIALGARTIQYESVWSSDVRLWSHATSTHPRSFFAWIKLGEVLRDAERFDGAVDAYANAVEIQPSARLAYAGLLMTLVRRDERDEHLAPPSRAEAIAERYARHADDADLLRRDALEMIDQGYRMGALFVLSRSLDIAPVSQERLERAAQIQLANDREWLARFYVGRMTRRPILPTVTRFYDEERERLGIVDPPREDDMPPQSTDTDGEP
jgi:hypothetical protein